MVILAEYGEVGRVLVPGERGEPGGGGFQGAEQARRGVEDLDAVAGFPLGVDHQGQERPLIVERVAGDVAETGIDARGEVADDDIGAGALPPLDRVPSHDQELAVVAEAGGRHVVDGRRLATDEVSQTELGLGGLLGLLGLLAFGLGDADGVRQPFPILGELRPGPGGSASVASVASMRNRISPSPSAREMP